MTSMDRVRGLICALTVSLLSEDNTSQSWTEREHKAISGLFLASVSSYHIPET